MKKSIIAFLMLFAVIAVQAQNDSVAKNNFGKNELKLNSFFLILGALEPSYERNLSESSSAGISLFIALDDENFDMNVNYYVSPYYRIFFGKKYAAGFFLEGFGMLNSTKREYSYSYDYDQFKTGEEDVTDFALGFGLGGKWMTTSGFVFEVSGGIGRNLFNTSGSDYYDYTPIVGKFGFNLGYRF